MAGVQRPMRRLTPTAIALIGGIVLLLVLAWFFSSNRNPDQDKLSDGQIAQGTPPDPEKRCAAKATYDFIKRDLFRRAAELRGSDQPAFDKLAAYAVLRMENPVLEAQDTTTGALSCSAAASLDLPPGVTVVGGRRTLTADVDYTIQSAADGSGDVILLRGADAIITPLATLARVAGEAAPGLPPPAEVPPAPVEGRPLAPQPVEPPPPPARPSGARPSYDCANARTSGEMAVCADSGLASLDVNMAAQYRRALAEATPGQRQVLQSTRDRFLAYRDRCPNRQCMADAYTGRMREIRDIMEGRWRPR